MSYLMKRGASFVLLHQVKFRQVYTLGSLRGQIFINTLVLCTIVTRYKSKD